MNAESYVEAKKKSILHFKWHLYQTQMQYMALRGSSCMWLWFYATAFDESNGIKQTYTEN